MEPSLIRDVVEILVFLGTAGLGLWKFHNAFNKNLEEKLSTLSDGMMLREVLVEKFDNLQKGVDKINGSVAAAHRDIARNRTDIEVLRATKQDKA